MLQFKSLSMRSTWDKNILRQQQRVKPILSNDLPTSCSSSMFMISFWNYSHLWAITLPQLKQRTGIIICFHQYLNYYPLYSCFFLYLFLFTTSLPQQSVAVQIQTFLLFTYFQQSQVMRPYPDTADESFMDKLESKIRQLVFEFGKEEDAERRKLLEQQITRYNKLMKEIQPYYRYQKLTTQQRKLRHFLQETQNVLKLLQKDLSKKQQQNLELTQMKSEYQTLVERVMRGKEYEYKINALNSQIRLIQDIAKFEDKSFIENGLQSVSITKKQLMRRKDEVEEEKSEIDRTMARFKADIQNQYQLWNSHFQRKNQLLAELNAEKTKNIQVQIEAPLQKKSQRSQAEQPKRQLENYQIRKKKMNFSRIETKKQHPTIYIVWTIILLLWACWLLWSTFRNKSKGDELSY